MSLPELYCNRLLSAMIPVPDHLSIPSLRTGHRLKRAIGSIQAVSVTPDDALLAAVSNDLVVLYAMPQKTEIMRHVVDSGKAATVSLCPSGKTLALGTSMGEVIVYDLGTMEIKRTLKLPIIVQSLSVCRSPGLIASATQNMAFVHSVDTGESLGLFRYDSKIRAVSISQNPLLLRVCTEKLTHVLDIKTGKEIANILPRTWEEDATLDSAHAAIHVSGYDVALFDARRRVALKSFRYPAAVQDADIDTNHKCLITSCADGKIWAIDVDSDENSHRSYGHPDVGQYICIAQSDRQVVSGGDCVRLFDKNTLVKTGEIRGHTSPVICVRLTRDEKHLLVAGYHGVLKMYDLTNGRQVRRFGKHSSWISDIALDEDMEIIATSSHDRTVNVFTLSGNLIHRLSGHTDCVHAVAINSKSGILATGARDHRIILWDLDSGRPIADWKAHRGYVRSLAFDTDGRRLLSAGNDGMARLWRPEKHIECLTEYGFHSDDVYSAVFSPDEKYVLTASQDLTFKLHNIDGTFKMHFIGHTNGVREVSYHKDGTLVSASLDGSAKRWNPDTGEWFQTYGAAHTDWLRCVMVRSDGLVILGSRDGTISFSDIETGKLLLTLHNLDHGFLWTTPADDNAKSGWFWTDRQELIETVTVESNGTKRPLDPSEDDHNDYFSTYNSMLQTMSRLTKSDAQKQLFEKMVSLHETLQKGQTEVKRLVSS